MAFQAACVELSQPQQLMEFFVSSQLHLWAVYYHAHLQETCLALNPSTRKHIAAKHGDMQQLS
jgi:hypothetical protein